MPVDVPALDLAAHWPVQFQKGQLIYDEDDLSEAMYRVRKGCVRLQVNGPDGGRQIVQFVTPGRVFGFCSERRDTAAEAVTDVDLIRYSLHSVMELCAVNSAAALELMDHSTQSYRELAHHAERVAHLSAIDHVSWFFEFLLKDGMYDGATSPRQMLMNHKDVADYLGITPETLSRSLRVLQDRGEIGGSCLPRP
jgi:CRP/FNR family nitrogen fixation transcriptional regulator